MINKLGRCWVSVAAIGFCLLSALSAYPQKTMEEPITKDGLFKALETKLTDSGLEYLIERIKTRGVSFELSDSDKQKLRSLQRGLNQKQLDKLIAALKANYHPTPSVKFDAYILPTDPPYAPETKIGGITWDKHYSDVRLDITNGPVLIQNVDLSIRLDIQIAAVGQISEFPGVTIFPADEMPAIWLEGTDEKGQPITVPIVPTPSNMVGSVVYRVHCDKLFSGATLHLVIATVAMNPMTAKGEMPDQLFAPKRAPRKIQVKGTYETSGVDGIKRFPIEFSYTFSDDKYHPNASEPIAAQPRREQPTFRGNPEYVTLKLGGNVETVAVAKLKSKKFSPVEMANTEPIHLYVEDETLFADVTLNSGRNAPPIEIKHNQFDNIPVGWDLNSNQVALEIVDEQTRPVFQLVYKQPDQVRINGVFRFPIGVVVLTDSGAVQLGPSQPIPFERIKRIFKYPADLYPGQYAAEASAQPTLEEAKPPELKADEPKPNLTIVSYGIMNIIYDPATRIFKESGLQGKGIPAVVVQIRNAHEPGKEIIEANAIRAHIYYEPFGNYTHLGKDAPGPTKVDDGVWFREAQPIVNFARGETKTLIVAVQSPDGSFGAFEHPIEQREGIAMPFPLILKLTADLYMMRVEITGGAHGEISELYPFTLMLRPEFKISR
jgi:hypothetical protein